MEKHIINKITEILNISIEEIERRINITSELEVLYNLMNKSQKLKDYILKYKTSKASLNIKLTFN